MPSRRFLALFVVALLVVLPNPVHATAIADSTLTFSNLSITPASGSLTLDNVWLLQAFGSANNSLGGSDGQFNFAFSPDTTSAGASVTWATVTGIATALGDPADLDVHGSAMSSVNIPGCSPAAAFSDGFGTLSNSFTVSGTGTVAVQIGIDIAGMLHALTDACGLNTFTRTIFSLVVDGNTLLLDDRMFDPNNPANNNFADFLTGTFLLDAGVSHSLQLQASSEGQAQTQIPEPSSSALLLVALGALVWAQGTARATGRPRKAPG